MADRIGKGWNRPLRELMPVLQAEALERVGDVHDWAWRQLPGGALVALRIDDETHRCELRIARPGAEPIGAKREKWKRELAVFREHLGVEHWDLVYYERTRGKRGYFALYREPVKAEAP